MKVLVFLRETSQPVEYDNVINTYQKGDFFCIYFDKNKVHKYPVISIWRVEEDYVPGN